MRRYTVSRGGVEDTRLEAKAKDTKKIRGQGPRTAFPRTDTLEARTENVRGQGQGHKRICSPKKKKVFTKFFSDLKKKKKRSSQKFFKRSPQKTVFQKIFQALHKILTHSKNSAVLEPRTGQFSRTWGLEAKAKNFKICPRGLHLWLLGTLRSATLFNT